MEAKMSLADNLDFVFTPPSLEPAEKTAESKESKDQPQKQPEAGSGEPPEEKPEGEEAESEESEEETEEESSEAEPLPLDDNAVYKIGDEELTGKQIREGWLRQQDYTKKTQELAEQRKALEVRLSEAEKAAQGYVEAQSRAFQMLDQLVLGPLADQKYLDKLAEEDPEEYVRATKNRQAVLDAANKIVESIRETEKNLFISRFQRLFPDANTNEAAQKLYASALAQAKQLPVPYTDEELAARPLDPRVVYLLNEYGKVKESLEKMRQAKTSAPPLKTVKPSIKQATREQKPKKLERYIDGSPFLNFPTMEE